MPLPHPWLPHGLFFQSLPGKPAVGILPRMDVLLKPSAAGLLESSAVVFVLAVLIGVAGQLAANRWRMPPIAIWLLIGMLLGPSGLHLLRVESIKPALHTLIELGLAIILFEGGLNLNLRTLREHGWIIGRLVVIGPIVTILLGGGLIHVISNLDWPTSLLFGALVAIGGPTVIQPIVRQVRLDRSVRHILLGEAMLVDAVGAILAIVMLQFALAPQLHLDALLQAILAKMLIGGVVGYIGGKLLCQLLVKDWFRDQDLRSIATLAWAWGLYMLADTLSEQAGLMSVLVAGTVLQRTELPDIQRLRHFKASLSVLLISVLFVLLAADLDLRILEKNLWQGCVLFLFLFLIVRPSVALLAGIFSKLSISQIAFLGFMAPRGVVAAAIASLFSLILQEHGNNDSASLLAMVYIIIILSILVYGFLAKPLSRRLNVDAGDERSVLIVGGGQFGAELGRVLSEDREVRFLDLNAEVINKLKRSGFMAVRGNALDPFYMEIVHAEEVGCIVVMTGSSDHNLLIAQLAHDEFHVPEIYVALQEGDEIKHQRLIKQLRVHRLFGKPYSFTYWNDQAYRKRLVYEIRRVESNSPLIGKRLRDVQISHGVIPIAILREGKTFIPHDDFTFQAWDEVWFVLRPEKVVEGQPLIYPARSTT